MALTKSWTPAAETLSPAPPRRPPRPLLGWLALIAASALVAGGLARVYSARTENFPDLAAKLSRGELLNVNRSEGSAALTPFLETFAAPAQRDSAAERMDEFLKQNRPLRNLGALAALRSEGPAPAPPLLPLGRLKPLMVVRTPEEFRSLFRWWIAAYFGGFYLVAVLWTVRRFPGDWSLLPPLHLLTGLGLILMLSLRDPLRDSLEFRKFVFGVLLGCLLLALPLFRFFDYRRLANQCYTPLFAAFGLFALLLLFGSGPGSSSTKVNLGPFQPVELIKICVVLFLAGYFSRQWERLRDLRQERFLPVFLRGAAARLRDVLPVCAAVAVSLALFFVLKDLGPAFVILFVFLSLFVVARGRPGLALLAIALMVGAVTAGYRAGTPRTVADRIDMWLSPWDNDVRGGNQLAHSLWALSTGGPWGSGPGWGDPSMIPASHTDLVLPAIGEEWGFAGVAAAILLTAFLVWRGSRIAVRAGSYFGFFLALGLTSLVAFEMLLITAGVLGVLPLSGVVSPFLSSGNTAMLANFFVVAALLSVASRTGAVESPDLLARPARRLRLTLAAAALVLLAAAARYQVFGDRDYLAREARSYEEDGVKRAQRNPRINSIAREIPRGSIVDRNGLPAAASDWETLERHREGYAALGISIDEACSRLDSRHYPFGGAAVHVVGDLRTGENFHAVNASMVEHDANRKLRGYEYAELVPLMRSRHQPGNPGLARILARDRNVHLTLDLRLQVRATAILERGLRAAGAAHGAMVVMSAATGDVLAMVTLPSIEPPGRRTGAPTKDELLDRARYGQYPPGSTFKLVTAIAALRADPALKTRQYRCRPFAGGRVGALIPGWNRPIYDDIGDHAHGALQMETAIAVSCNAWFAQLGVHGTGSRALADTAALLGFPSGDLAELRRALPFAAYGQGPMLATPFKMARVSALIANGGRMPQGRWTVDDSNTRTEAPLEVLPVGEAAFLGRAMRQVVTRGTGRRAMAGEATAVAGKTGTAQVDHGSPHAWFTGFAPYDGDPARRIAFAVLVEHGGYGGRVAAPIAREVVDAARELGLIP